MSLTKSQRLTLITSIADRLSGDSWTTIDLTLKSFGFPVTDEWSGDKQSYVVTSVESRSDDDLVELGEHFGIEVAGGASASNSQPETPYWEEGRLKVFISHLSSEREQAGELQNALAGFGMSGFVAHVDIHPTAEWQNEIENALTTCDLLVALVHPDFVNSQWCDQEIGYALGRGIPVFTVKCGANPYGFVSRFQAFNGNGKTPVEIANDIFDAAIIHKKLQAQMAEVLVDLFIQSGSFATAKRRVSFLEQLTVWKPEFSARIAKAVEENGQISGSWGVPAQVTNLVNKWKPKSTA